MNLDTIWEEYGFDKLQEGMDRLFPTYDLSFSELMHRLMQGDLIDVLSDLLKACIGEMAGATVGMKNVFVWLMVLGVVSALMSHFVEVFDRHQVADLSFYFLYLLMSAILLKCFAQASEIAVEAMENVALFSRLLVPAYLVAVGIAAGSLTAGAYYELLLVLICGVEQILLGVVVPLIYSYCLLAVINGIWIEEKLNLLIELFEKLLGWILKASLWLVTGISVFQSVLTPVVDAVKNDALQKAISAIPGIGNGAEGVVNLAVGSAVIVKNSVGLGLLILLLFLCAGPLFQLFLIALLLKAAAAFMGIVSDKRIISCTNRVGDGAFFLFKLTGTTMLLFLITIAVVAISTNRGI